MLTLKQFEGLKKVNLTQDSEKTKSRLSEDFKSTSNENKKEILRLSGLSNATVYNAFKKGIGSAKMVLAMAQVLNVSPYYYIGADDVRNEFSEELLDSFLNEYNLKNSTKKLKAGKAKAAANKKVSKRTAAPSPEKEIKDAPMKSKAKADKAHDDTIVVTYTFDNSKKMRGAISSLDEDSAVLLFKALMKKAEAGGDAELLCDIVKRCLLS